ncbi:hypothetical protein I4U23_004742 [Adineta vaga]|nr:hypothetical protein I4U23_004742 [Adineta vaga]
MKFETIVCLSVLFVCIKGQTTQIPNYYCNQTNETVEFTLSSLVHSAWNPMTNCSLSRYIGSSTNNNICQSLSTHCFDYHTSNNTSLFAPAIECSILEACDNITYTCVSNTSVCIINSCCSAQTVCLPLSVTNFCISGNMSATASSTTSSMTTTKSVCATLITFDDIPSQSSSSGVVPNGYNDLNWTNVNYINASSTPISGFQRFLPVSPYVAYNPGGVNITIASANGSSFSFDRITWISAWRDNLTVSIALYRSGALRLSNSRVLNTVNSTTFSCSICTNIDTISFAASSGTPVSGWSQSGTEFVFDNLCISFGY